MTIKPPPTAACRSLYELAHIPEFTDLRRYFVELENTVILDHAIYLRGLIIAYCSALVSVGYITHDEWKSIWNTCADYVEEVLNYQPSTDSDYPF